jgi:hypothetical protein
LVDSVIDVPEDATSFELLLDGNPIATFRVAGDPGAPPENVELKQVGVRGAGAEDGDAAPWTLSWDDPARPRGGPEEAGNRTYVVQASTDEGETWTTLAVGAKSTEVEVEPTDFADAEKVRFRVLTTNGVSYSESTTDDVVLQEEGS